MLGAIAGDIIGSRFERDQIKSKEFDLFHPDCSFTDDTVLTVAVADSLQNGTDIIDNFHKYFSRYLNAGWGATFAGWASKKDTAPYNSWANGAAMRVSPVSWFCQSLTDVQILAEKTAAVTHNHPVGIEGAVAVATAIFIARKTKDKNEIINSIEQVTKYDLNRKLAEIRDDYQFELKADLSVPEAIISFLESESFEDAIRNAISLGGDSDTQACIAGSIAEAYYGIPEKIIIDTKKRLDSFLLIKTIAFEKEFINSPQPI